MFDFVDTVVNLVVKIRTDVVTVKNPFIWVTKSNFKSQFTILKGVNTGFTYKHNREIIHLRIILRSHLNRKVLTVTLQTGSAEPKGKNFTCNVFTISTHFSPLEAWLLSFEIPEFMDKISFILEYFECLKFSSFPNSKIHLKISKFAKFNLNMADDSVKMEDGKKYSPRTLRKRVTF